MTSLQATINRRFDRRHKLPDQVFKDSGSLGFLLTDSALITAADCWSVVQTLALRFGDRVVVAEAVEDLRKTRLSPLETFAVAATASGEAFVRWLREPQSTRTEPLYIDARIIAVVGSSGAWGLWFEQDKELAVLGVPSGMLGPVRDDLGEVSTWPWHEVSDVAELLGPAFEPLPVPAALVRDIRRSYASVRIGQ